jgi:hypothetical protein
VQNTSQRASTIGDGSPLTVNYSLLKCTTHVPFVLVQNTSQRSSTIDDGLCLRSLNYSLLRCTTHVPFVLVQNTSQRASTIGDGSPLTVNYSLLKCTTHVPFVLVQNTSQRFLPLVSSQPSHLWLSAVRRSPACLPAARSHRASPSPAVKSEPTSPCISPHVLGSWKPGDDLHTMLRPQESEQHPCFALKRASSR